MHERIKVVDEELTGPPRTIEGLHGYGRIKFWPDSTDRRRVRLVICSKKAFTNKHNTVLWGLLISGIY